MFPFKRKRVADEEEEEKKKARKKEPASAGSPSPSSSTALKQHQQPPTNKPEQYSAKRLRFDGVFLNRPFAKPDKHERDLQHPLFPAIPFTTIVLGPPGSGKSNLLMNLLRHPYFGMFDHIYIFHPNFYIDETYHKGLDTTGVKVFDDPKTWGKELESIIEKKDKIVSDALQNGKRKKIKNDLIVFDDAIKTIVGSSTNASPLIPQLSTFNRKLNLSIYYMAHRWNSQLDRALRTNATDIIVLPFRSHREYKDFKDEMRAPNVPSKLFDKLYATATSEPHSFFYVNLRARDEHSRYSHGFDKPFFI